jgi:hypothetical protein
MGKVKELWFEQLENNPVLHEQYWRNEMFNSHEPVLPTYSNPLLEQNHEENLRIQQYQPRQNAIGRRASIIQR